MADINRQLQEYLAQSKSGGKAGSPSGSSTIDIGDAESPSSGSGTWFGRWSSPFSGPGSGGQGSTPGVSWSWSSEPDSCLPGMSRSQRLLGFGICVAMSVLCFGLSALYAPLLLLKARKFALLWSLGSVFALVGAAILRGPSTLLATPSPGAALYLTALTGTLYAALSLHSTVLTALGAALQIAAIVGYIIALIPGGSTGIRFLSGMVASAVKRTASGKTLPI
ncbi:Vesicle transport protein SFT2C [Acipenser ruthenus]|uniref:Vesicle transport protein n=1 Tax=Acipenser ruthenus TaxID=7906 RepID=A0A444U0P9_ACIRT|nr:vesicle transport protein SFT2C-like [Acipenser ruthenus]RXM28732.1 Vesicle transport protein SFT2C [Acipenser ruthenus]